MLARMQRNLIVHILLVGMRNGTVTLEMSMAVFGKSEHATTTQQAIVLLGIYPEQIRTYVHKKPVHNIHNCSIHSSPTLKIMQMSFNEISQFNTQLSHPSALLQDYHPLSISSKFFLYTFRFLEKNIKKTYIWDQNLTKVIIFIAPSKYS